MTSSRSRPVRPVIGSGVWAGFEQPALMGGGVAVIFDSISIENVKIIGMWGNCLQERGNGALAIGMGDVLNGRTQGQVVLYLLHDG
jgi:hypothetical protein